MRWTALWPIAIAARSLAFTLHSGHLQHAPALPLGLHDLLHARETSQLRLQTGVSPAGPAYRAHTLQVPVDHRDDANHATFALRYWFDAQHYRPGGPVYILDGGETSGANRLAFLDHGILPILAEPTGGLSIVLEHRYYGRSFPVTNLSTHNLRFLTTEQHLEDGAYFVRNVNISGVGPIAHSPVIWYGGSYAGAIAAFMRVQYPDLIFGAIASSAVTHAQVDYWQYMEAIRLNADPACVAVIVDSVALVDRLLATDGRSVRKLFGLPNVTSDADFANVLSLPLGSWQARNWDPAEGGSTAWDAFCTALTSPAKPSLVPADSVLSPLEPYAAVVRAIAAICPPSASQDDCFGTSNATRYAGDVGLSASRWRSWTWQVCTEWGYFIGGAPAGVPSMVSRLLTVKYNHRICELAFPAGRHTSVPKWPQVARVNRYGDFALRSPRLAFIDGSADPWVYATPHSPLAPSRTSNASEPFLTIPGGVHHWDENGASDEPPEIARVHAQELTFVKAWLREWNSTTVP